VFELSTSRVADRRVSRRVELARLAADLGVGAAAGDDATGGRAMSDVAIGRGARVIARLERELGELSPTTDDGFDALTSDDTDQSVVANTSAMTTPDTRPEAKAIGFPDR